MNTARRSYIQESETARAHTVIVNEPGNEINIPALHPIGNLYEKSVNLYEARRDHKEFVNLMRKNNCEVVNLRDWLLKEASRELLVELACNSVDYEYNLKEKERENFKNIISEEYKLSNIRKFNREELVDIIYTRPIVKLEIDEDSKSLIVVENTIRPLGNLCFTRDQQIVTDKGIVMAKMQSQVRQGEVFLMKKFWKEYLRVKDVHSIKEGKLEGGDWIPLGNIAFLGIGLRTCFSAAHQLMREKLISYPTFILVIDEDDQSQQRMHLDTIFNIVNNNTAVLLDSVINRTHGRYVEVYCRDEFGNYKVNENYYKMDFYKFLIDILKFTIIPVTEQQQSEYIINFLNMGYQYDDDNDNLNNNNPSSNNKTVPYIISVHPALNNLLKDAKVNARVDYLPYSAMTNMYGAAHCCTQVFRY